MGSRRTLSRSCRVLLGALLIAAAAAPLDAADFLYSWTASTDPTVTTYGIYQRIGNSAYQRIDEVRVADLDDPARPSYLVTGLGEGATFWFAATSISGAGTESDLDNKTCITVNGQVVQCTDQDDTGSTVFISCFISTAQPPSRR
ncbi:MAG: hypothetical protein EHM15_07610 [Desulfobacteraceae bacterium]|nr:MAG: hypothetical protein EHM15_07610 [Desulfobacteraceae bacterium]